MRFKTYSTITCINRGINVSVTEARFCISRYRCLKSTVCINNGSLCNGVKDCPLGDDEQFCGFRWVLQSFIIIT